MPPRYITMIQNMDISPPTRCRRQPIARRDAAHGTQCMMAIGRAKISFASFRFATSLRPRRILRAATGHDHTLHSSSYCYFATGRFLAQMPAGFSLLQPPPGRTRPPQQLDDFFDRTSQYAITTTTSMQRLYRDAYSRFVPSLLLHATAAGMATE